MLRTLRCKEMLTLVLRALFLFPSSMCPYLLSSFIRPSTSPFHSLPFPLFPPALLHIHRGFIPSPGHLKHLATPTPTPTVRVDTGVRQGDHVTTFYDPMIAKLVVWDQDRTAALKKLQSTLSQYQVKYMPCDKSRDPGRVTRESHDLSHD